MQFAVCIILDLPFALLLVSYGIQ